MRGNVGSQMIVQLKAILFTMAFPLIALSQQKPSFEIASIKPAVPIDLAKGAAIERNGGEWLIGARIERGRAEFTSMDLQDLIGFAYGVRPYDIAGPDWLTARSFDIVAKMPATSSREDAQKMLQSLLEDRFGLVAHRAETNRAVLALTTAESDALKLKPSAGTPAALDENAPLRPGQIRMDIADGPSLVTFNRATATTTKDMGLRGKLIRRDDPATGTLYLDSSMTTMGGLVDTLNGILSQLTFGNWRQIVDLTGLRGYFDISLEISLADMTAVARPGVNDGAAAPPTAPDPRSEPSLSEALQKLGLKLESRTAPVSQLVIDRLEKTPNEN